MSVEWEEFVVTGAGMALLETEALPNIRTLNPYGDGLRGQQEGQLCDRRMSCLPVMPLNIPPPGLPIRFIPPYLSPVH